MSFYYAREENLCNLAPRLLQKLEAIGFIKSPYYFLPGQSVWAIIRFQILWMATWHKRRAMIRELVAKSRQRTAGLAYPYSREDGAHILAKGEK